MSKQVKEKAKELCEKSGCHHKCHSTEDCVVEDEAIAIIGDNLPSTLKNEEKISEKYCCVVMDRKGACPLSKAELFGNSEQLVVTGDWLDRYGKLYEVVIADDNIFVVCPLKHSKKEKSMVVKYSRPEIYANQKDINTLTELGFDLCYSKRFKERR